MEEVDGEECYKSRRITNVPHFFEYVQFARYDTMKTRLMHCSSCKQLIWEVPTLGSSTKGGFDFFRCQGTIYVQHMLLFLSSGNSQWYKSSFLTFSSLRLLCSSKMSHKSNPRL